MQVPFAAEILAIQGGGEFIVKALQRITEELQAQPFRVGASYVRTGRGSPEGAVVGDIGDLYLRTDGADATSLSTKSRNTGSNTGWRAVDPGSSEFTIPTTTNDAAHVTFDDLDFQNASLIRMNNTYDTTIRGLKTGYPGQIVTIVSLGDGYVFLAHASTGSVAANRLTNYVTTGNTPLGFGSGRATYQYDVTTSRWRLIFHEQGGWITPTFAAGDFTGNGAMTWTLTGGDVTTMRYHLRGTSLTVQFNLVTTTVGGTPDTTLQIGNGQWGGFSIIGALVVPYIYNDNLGGNTAGFLQTSGTATLFELHKITGNWSASTNQTYLFGSITFPVS